MSSLAISTVLVTYATFALAQVGLSWWQLRGDRRGNPASAQPAFTSAVAALLAVSAGLAVMDADAIGRNGAATSPAVATVAHSVEGPGDDAISQLEAYVKRLPRGAPLPMTPIPDPSQGESLPDVETMIARLAQRLEGDDSDADGWRTLGWSHAATGNHAAAVGAYRRAMTLRPDDLEIKAATAEAMIKAAAEVVDARSVELLDAILREAPDHPRARFYRALAKEQAGDTKAAVEEWTALLAANSGDADLKAEVEARIARASPKRNDG